MSLAKILITLGVIVYAMVVPSLEINATHVFNEAWPPHARFHEVWQLTTNGAIGILTLWLAVAAFFLGRRHHPPTGENRINLTFRQADA